MVVTLIFQQVEVSDYVSCCPIGYQYTENGRDALPELFSGLLNCGVRYERRTFEVLLSWLFDARWTVSWLLLHLSRGSLPGRSISLGPRRSSGRASLRLLELQC
ncbi:hypothetical protein CRENBAI_022647 [Crenichthys baileyi]|uniref:Uncharacterized protein n=1 Tax=Crenichthys baileyi TaxID=28760 RepID=A0AAV9RI24_9TELE